MKKNNNTTLQEISKELFNVVGHAKLIPNPFNIKDANVYCISIDDLHKLNSIKEKLTKLLE